VLAAKLILDIQTIVSREMDPIDPAVITVGSIHGGTKHNIIPDNCHLQLTVRSYGDEDRKQLIDAIQRKAKAAAMSVNAKEPLVTVSEGTPALANDQELSDRIFKLFKQKFGDAKVLESELSMGGEDFSHFGRSGIPSLMFSLGVVDQNRLDRYQELETPPPSLHSALFYPDIERSLTTGVLALSTAVLDLLPRQSSQD
jgi:hippurate hydrolase